MLYEVYVEKTTGGRVRVEAEDPEQAFQIVSAAHEDDWDVEWGSCGDGVEVFDDVEEAYIPPELEVDPEWKEYLRLRKRFGKG